MGLYARQKCETKISDSKSSQTNNDENKKSVNDESDSKPVSVAPQIYIKVPIKHLIVPGQLARVKISQTQVAIATISRIGLSLDDLERKPDETPSEKKNRVQRGFVRYEFSTLSPRKLATAKKASTDKTTVTDTSSGNAQSFRASDGSIRFTADVVPFFGPDDLVNDAQASSCRQTAAQRQRRYETVSAFSSQRMLHNAVGETGRPSVLSTHMRKVSASAHRALEFGFETFNGGSGPSNSTTGKNNKALLTLHGERVWQGLRNLGVLTPMRMRYASEKHGKCVIDDREDRLQLIRQKVEEAIVKVDPTMRRQISVESKFWIKSVARPLVEDWMGDFTYPEGPPSPEDG